MRQLRPVCTIGDGEAFGIQTRIGNVPVEEAKECVQVAKREKCEAIRTVLLGMAVGCLRLGDRAKSAEAIKLQPDEVPPLHG